MEFDIKEISKTITKLLVYGQKNKRKVQTLILSKSRFRDVKSAKKWVVGHGFSVHKVDETANSFRFRQRNPSEFKSGSFRTITLSSGIKAVIGILKED